VALGAGAGAGTVIWAPARAAEFAFKLGHAFNIDEPEHVRLTQMAAAVAVETKGRLEIAIFPGSTLGSQTSMLSQLRLNSIQMLTIGNSSYTGLVPVAAIDSIGFSFTSQKQAFSALDGPLGAYIRSEFAQKGIYVFEKAFDVGFREVTSSNKAMRNADDFAGFKIRTPPGAVIVDLFKAIGAAPVPLGVNDLYTALQTHIVDGQETPLQSVESYRLYEVQKYLSITNHLATGAWLTVNGDAWTSLPPDLQSSLKRNAAKAADQERADTAVQATTLTAKLQSQGLVVNTVDIRSLRARLSTYYAKWRSELGSTAWDLLEGAVGKLG
jgi:tripartite ATP-independent transporter DctP family solute receptor